MKNSKMEIKLTHKFPKKDGIYMVQTKHEDSYDEPFLAEIMTDEFPDITVMPIPSHNHNDNFCVTKGDKNIKFFGPIRFK